MSKVKILDCTLRDGGYINDWNFGEKTIKKIIAKLHQSNIDIIECGFIADVDFDRNKSLFDSIERVREYIGPQTGGVSYVGMIAQPYPSIDKIAVCKNDSINGIRLTFHEDEIEEALLYAEKLMGKGYKVFIQPVGTTSYSDIRLLELIKRVNNLKPYAFYLVDTLGIMYKNDLLRMFHLLDNNLDKSITIGFHSHNNLQLSFSNAQELLMLNTKRNIIIDSSVFGMGRGAGNLCTELVTHYINENIERKYNIVYLLEIFDEHLSKISTEPKWGYSIPYFIAAVNNCHPNYATYLINKQTISVKLINIILGKIPLEMSDIYDEQYVEDLYIEHQINLVNDIDNLEKIKKLIAGRKVLIIAPGKSIEKEREKVDDFIKKHDPFVFCVNSVLDFYMIDAVFISNSKKFPGVYDAISKKHKNVTLINTSNITISDDQFSLVVNYSDLIIENPIISDNAGLMLINLLNQLSVSSVYLAGFDGFSVNKVNNYFSDEMINSIEIEELANKNEAISKYLEFMDNKIDIQFITSSAYCE